MSGATPGLPAQDCRQARLHIGADPRNVPADVAAHVEGCAACRGFRDEMQMIDGKVHAALGLPLSEFRRPARPARRFALAASVLLGVIIAGGAWLFRPATALASEVVQHVEEEADSWNMDQPLPPEQVGRILDTAGAQFDSPFPVVYGYPCPFRGHRVAHLVVRTPNGPMTVMLIPHERVMRRTAIEQSGMQGVLLPAGPGSVALLTRDGKVPEAMAEDIVSRVRW
jgi:hypothetical protein